MRERQTLDHVLAASLEAVGALLDERQPRTVVVQGDTTSMLGAALAAFHRRVPVAHVEAGLRSGSLDDPFPEEMNRRAASVVATWHFAPTSGAAARLAAEGITAGVQVTGNTVVDALRFVDRDPRTRVPDELAGFLDGSPYLLATAHRRESWDGGIEAIARALGDVLAAVPELRLVFVTHPNPVARDPVERVLGDVDRARILDAIDYRSFVALLRGARAAVSDSGGVQEEGPTLGVPVLVTRRTTERPEGVDAGAVRLVGTDRERIRVETLALLTDPELEASMRAAGHGLYGDGTAGHRIVEVLLGASSA
jgi:UDP-N-acetylglucosamine 2-epimerase (non-hydrolysing)